MNENRIRHMVLEELSKQEVRNIINSKLNDYIKEREFKKAVRQVAADVLEDFFKEAWRKNGFWKNQLKNG